MIKKQTLTTITLVLFSMVGSVCSQEESPLQVLNERGNTYTLKNSNDPIPNRIHILRVDLALDKVKPVVALGPDPDGDGPAEVSLTDPRKLAASPSVLAFVNTNPWDSFPDAQGKKKPQLVLRPTGRHPWPGGQQGKNAQHHGPHQYICLV